MAVSNSNSVLYVDKGGWWIQFECQNSSNRAVTFAEWLHVFACVLPLATFPLDWASSNDQAWSNSRAAFFTFASLRIPWPTSCVVF